MLKKYILLHCRNVYNMVIFKVNEIFINAQFMFENNFYDVKNC